MLPSSSGLLEDGQRLCQEAYTSVLGSFFPKWSQELSALDVEENGKAEAWALVGEMKNQEGRCEGAERENKP